MAEEILFYRMAGSKHPKTGIQKNGLFMGISS
jgi:hypothetical protein